MGTPDPSPGSREADTCDADEWGAAACYVDGRCRCTICARCGHHTGNSHQGHHWDWCKVTRTMRTPHFCCTDPAFGCELEAAPPVAAALDADSPLPGMESLEPVPDEAPTAIIEPPESLGEVLHRAREAGNDARIRPLIPEDWADRDPRLKELDEAMAAAVAAAERERIAAVLREHYLAGITCDHARKEDNPVCACSRVFLGWHPSIGAAVEAWTEHVLAVAGEPQERSDEKEADRG